MTFKRPVTADRTSVLDAERNVIAHTYEEYVATRIADALNHSPVPEERAPASENYRLALAFQIRHKGLEVLNSLDNPYQAWEAIIAALEAHSSPQKE